ncbi:bifunctional diguanylate cyclase/phosphodiesterase [Acidovorax sp. sif1233]|uniref:putative bifunctional diguanylate cyclase/phosphodiesterase n=1 Tax=Acidovorax sp. sif1233 TaxID=2854792 RepID=UPI00210709B4|nr:EAL domain-containing protein [Acidovorax sp. sif1233]
MPSLDSVVQIAARIFGMPVAAVNLIGDDHVFFAASTGFEGQRVDMRRDVSFCAHAIARNEVMVVPDASRDARFYDNPLVTGFAGVRFYAGVPLYSPGGLALGALCVIDSVPDFDFSDDDRARLADLAQMACDRLELRRLEHSTERARRPFEDDARTSPTAVVWFDESLRVMAWNKAAASIFGHVPADGPGRLVVDFLAERHRAAVGGLIAQAAAAGTADGLVVPDGLAGVRKDGLEFPLGVALFCWRDKGKLTFHAHLQDLSSHPGQSAELRRLSTTDLLTGLANRASLYRRMEEALAGSAGACLLLVDIDGFKDVNDTLGHGVGDGVLREAAQRLVECVPSLATVARTGGDEFAVLIPGCTSHRESMAAARSIVDSLAEPISVNVHEIRITASCGLAAAPGDAQEALELFSNADLALFKAKSYGRGQVFAYAATLRMEATARRLYSIELHRAVSEGEFVLFYQPQIRLSDGSLRGAEALIRWQHPQRGLLSPAAFLPALENGPLASVVGFWVLDEACAQAAHWRRCGATDFRIGVNLFGAQFRVNDMAAEVAATLQRHGLPPHALELEVTENIVLDDDDLVLGVLEKIKGMGVGIAFDDFGTGYASLSLLKKYPVTRLKIDRSFVQSTPESERDTAVVRAILDMARSFDLETVAEGVETEMQRDYLKDCGCQEGQGYLFSRPVSSYEFSESFRLRTENRMGKLA